MVTSGLISYILKFLHITVHIRDICVFLAPLFSGLTCISTFLLTKEIWSKGAGLYAAIFISIGFKNNNLKELCNKIYSKYLSIYFSL